MGLFDRGAGVRPANTEVAAVVRIGEDVPGWRKKDAWKAVTKLEPLILRSLQQSERLVHIANTDKSDILFVLTDNRVLVINGKTRSVGVEVEIAYSEVSGCSRLVHPDGPILRVERRGRVFPGLYRGDASFTLNNKEMVRDVDTNTVQAFLFSSSNAQGKEMENWIDLRSGAN